MSQHITNIILDLQNVARELHQEQLQRTAEPCWALWIGRLEDVIEEIRRAHPLAKPAYDTRHTFGDPLGFF